MRFFVPTAALLALAFAAPAQADVTASGITTPKSPDFVLYDGANTTIEVAGKATGIGNVDVACVDSTSTTILAGGVPVAGDGKFSVPAVSLDPLIESTSEYAPGRTCRLRALPTGATPAQMTLFRGPTLALSRFASLTVHGGDNDGQLSDFYLYAAGADRLTEAGSFGSCGVSSAVLDPVTLEPSDDGYACAGSTVDAPEVPLPGVKIDGQAAYAPGDVVGGIGGFGSGGLGGFPRFFLPSAQFDEATGAVTVAERERFAQCGPDVAYPPTQFSCGYLAPVPVELRRTTSVLPGDQIVRVVDHWSSTDAKAHRLDLTIRNATWRAGDNVYRFPGDSGFTRHDANDATPETDRVAGPFRAAAPILRRDAANTGVGLLVLPLQSADGARFLGPDEFGLEYRARTIPASGELTFTHYYATTRHADELDAAAAKLLASLSKPPATSPKGGGSPAVVTPAQPRLVRHGHLRLRRAGRTFRVVTRDRVVCATACVVRVGGRRIATSRTNVDAGRTAKVRFLLTRAGARKLRRVGHLGLNVKVSARAGTAPAVTAQRRLTLRIAR